MLPMSNKTMMMPIETVWDHPPPDGEQKNSQTKKLQSLANKVDKMAGVFEEETRARQEQRQLMDDLHEDQLKRLDEIGVELDQEMAKLAAFIEAFMSRFNTEVKDLFHALHSELQSNVDRLTPRLTALEARGRVLHAGIEEERNERIRHYTEMLVPLKAQIKKLESNLQRESDIRETRGEEIQQQMLHANEALEMALDTEIAAREDRQQALDKDWLQEQERLVKRRDAVNDSCEESLRAINEEADKEHEARTMHQDPVVEGLTKFMEMFHADVKEKAEMG